MPILALCMQYLYLFKAIYNLKMDPKNLAIVLPVYNDWESVDILITDLHTNLSSEYNLKILIVNDGSTITHNTSLSLNHLVEIINLTRNLGHQKAIAIGLSYLSKKTEGIPVIVMDADGEDNPEYIKELIATSEKSKDKIVFAKRTKRFNGPVFELLYFIYKITFKVLTGKTVNFGNFSYIPAFHLKMLVHISEIWNNYPSAIILSKIPYTTLPVIRCKRIKGNSKMSISSLIIHGLGAMSVHIESVVARVMFFCLLLICFASIAVFIVIYIKLFTSYASPGWATTIVFNSFTLILICFLISLFFLFITFSNRTHKKVIPVLDYSDYLKK